MTEPARGDYLDRAAVVREAEATKTRIVDMMWDESLRPHLQREDGSGGVQRCVYVLDELVKNLRDLPGDAAPESPEPTDRRFIIEHEAWYAAETFARRPERVLAAISIETGEAAWELVWKNVDARVNPDRPAERGLIAMQLTVFDDAWEAFALSGFDEVMTAVTLGRLDAGTPTPADVAEVLTRLGWTDATQYDTPDIYRTADLP